MDLALQLQTSALGLDVSARVTDPLLWPEHSARLGVKGALQAVDGETVASTDDGVLDLMVLTGRGWSGWPLSAASVVMAACMHQGQRVLPRR